MLGVEIKMKLHISFTSHVIVIVIQRNCKYKCFPFAFSVFVLKLEYLIYSILIFIIIFKKRRMVNTNNRVYNIY